MVPVRCLIAPYVHTSHESVPGLEVNPHDFFERGSGHDHNSSA